jgi:hypothetical protein
MKYLIALTSLLLATMAAPAFAHHGNECADAAAKLPMAERASFTKGCLARAAEHENSESIAQKEKEAQCDQNVKNQKLVGQMKKDYINHCYQENDFDPTLPPDPRGKGK